MPRLKPATQAARRNNILDAAERCFARTGFHRTTMQDICREAQVSAGALYVYFASKEELIAGICRRDRAKLAQQLGALAAAPDLLAALSVLAHHYSLQEPRHKRVLCLEIGAESTRNPAVREMVAAVDRYALDSLAGVLARGRAEGRISPAFSPRVLAEILALIGDGLFWRGAVDPDFDAEAMLPVLMSVVSDLLDPTAQLAGASPTSRRAQRRRRPLRAEVRREATK